MAPNGGVAVWMAKEADPPAQVLFGFIAPRHIGEGRRWALFVVQFGTAAPHSKDASSLLRLPHAAQEHVAKVDQQQDGESIEQYRQGRLPPGNLHGLSGDLDAVFL